MRVAQGGTRIWCPYCEEHTVCKGISPAEVTYRAEDHHQHWTSETHPDLGWFQRGRWCLTCNSEFLTVEIEQDKLWELMELRKALSDIKQHAETYIAESSAATRSLKALSSSLGVLRALRVYKNAD